MGVRNLGQEPHKAGREPCTACLCCLLPTATAINCLLCLLPGDMSTPLWSRIMPWPHGGVAVPPPPLTVWPGG